MRCTDEHHSESAIPFAPGRWPLLGHIPALAHAPLRFIRAVDAQGPVLRIRLAGATAYLVTDAALVRTMLMAESGQYVKSTHVDTVVELLGNSLSTASGAEHRDRRRMLQPAFHHQHIAGFAELVRRTTVELIDGWRDGQVIAIDAAMRRLALTIMAKALCASALDPRVVDLVERDLPVVMHGVAWRVMLSAHLTDQVPVPADLRFHAANRRLRRTVAELVTRYRSAGVDHGDLLSLLLAARRPGTSKALSDNEICGEVVNLLCAGTETIGTALAWLWYAVSQHAGVERRLRAEAASGSTEYARRVARETMRLYPPPWLVSRQTRRWVRLGAYDLPVGAHVLFSPYAIQRDPANYPNPERFDPDRWLPERAGESNRHAYLAFGAGAQNCIGQGFAMVELATVAGTIAASHRLVPTARTVEKASATLIPNQLNMVVTRAAAR